MEIAFTHRKAYNSGPSTVLSIPIAVLDSIVSEFKPELYQAKKEMQNTVAKLAFPTTTEVVRSFYSHEATLNLPDGKEFATKNALIQALTDIIYKGALDELRFDLTFDGKSLNYRLAHADYSLVDTVEDSE